MKSKSRGKSTLAVEVTHIDSRGFWLYAKGSEYFLSYDEYPWFKNTKLKEILNVRLLHDYHLYWPDLDIDLELDCIASPDCYPLKYK